MVSQLAKVRQQLTTLVLQPHILLHGKQVKVRQQLIIPVLLRLKVQQLYIQLVKILQPYIILVLL